MKNNLKTIGIFFSTLVFLFCSIGEVQAEERTYYQGIIVDQSFSGKVYLDPGEEEVFWVKYKNIGYYRWRNKGERTVFLRVSDEGETTKKFRSQFWLNESTIGIIRERTEVGESAAFGFDLRAPEEIGEYTIKLRPWAYGDWMDGDEIEISVVVGLEEILKQQEAENVDVKGVNNERGKVYEVGDLQYPEPSIRVGLYSLTQDEDDKIQIKGRKRYAIYDSEGKEILERAPGETSEVVFNYDTKRFYLNIDNQRYAMTDGYFRFRTIDGPNVFTIVNYYNPAYPGSSVNYNQFRGTLEIQWIEANEKLWVINELLMEDYVKGSGETMDISPYEFLKSMAVVERSYALLHYLNPTKHKVRNFTVTASQSDQIYQGYAREVRQPNIVRATEDSEGLIVIYDGEVALTPYYSQSDGRTRSYEEVWHRTTYPYLVSVPDPHMAGKRQIGHGVGMSARGALFTASRDGANFEDLIYHYYTGVEIEKVY